MSHAKQRTDFLRGGGEMGALMRAYDWTKHPLGRPDTWPAPLRTSLRVLLNTGHPMYLWWGPELYCFYNDAYRQSIGAERHPSSLGARGREVWDEIWDIIGPQIDQVMSGGAATWAENALVPITRDGVREDVYWTYSYGPIDDEKAASGVGGVLVVCTETTDQVMAAQRLAASEERVQFALTAGNGVGTWDWDVPNDRVIADERFAKIYGVDPERAKTGAPIAEFFRSIHPDDTAAVSAHIAEVLATGADFSAEYRLLQADGSERWVVAQGRAFLDETGVPVRFPGVSFDITPRKRVEQSLRDLNTDLARMVIERSAEPGTTWQVSPNLLSVIDMSDGKFLRVNPAWAIELGWSEEELTGAPYADFVHPDDLAASFAAFEQVQNGLPVLNFENRYRTRSGEYEWLSWVAVPEGGKLYSTSRLITGEKQRTVALEKAQDALRQSQKMEAVGQLTGGIAHDFNNLLAGISGSLDLLARRLAEGRVTGLDRYIIGAQHSARRAATLTQRLLAFSRRQTLDPKAVDLNRLIGGMEELVRRTVGPGVNVEVVGAGGLWPTLVDPSQLENALLNLAINARDAMPDGGRITIETANKWLDKHAAHDRDVAPGQYVSLCVTDTGTGMAQDVIERAFDPFFTTKPLGEGTGLGLSMIHGFVRQSGGEVRIYSELGKGTTMCLYFPRHLGELEQPEEASAPASTSDGHGETILVIDDEETVRMLMVEVLQEAGYHILEARDGPSGLKILQSKVRIDLLVSDVGLPGGMNGRQVADAGKVTRPDLKVLFITGYAENSVFGNGHLGADMEVITKPFNINELSARVRDMLEG